MDLFNNILTFWVGTINKLYTARLKEGVRMLGCYVQNYSNVTKMKESYSIILFHVCPCETCTH